MSAKEEPMLTKFKDKEEQEIEEDYHISSNKGASVEKVVGRWTD